MSSLVITAFKFFFGVDLTRPTYMHVCKAVTRGVFWVFEHPPKFQGKVRHTKTDLLLVTKFSKVTTGYPRYTHVFGSYKLANNGISVL